MSIELTLIGKPGCHLCDTARETIEAVLFKFRAANPEASVVIQEQNILDDEALQLKYAEEIPVLLIDGKMHNYWRIDEERLMRALYAKLKTQGA
jgi:glutaredoxin